MGDGEGLEVGKGVDDLRDMAAVGLESIVRWDRRWG